EDKENPMNVKKLLENADPELFHTLKMIKRHFYLEINHPVQTINEIISFIHRLKNNILLTLKGLDGQLEIALEIHSSEPNNDLVNQFKDKTYVLVADPTAVMTTWSLSYYEDKVWKKNISIVEVDPGITQLNSISEAIQYKTKLLRMVMIYHANHMSSKT